MNACRSTPSTALSPIFPSRHAFFTSRYSRCISLSDMFPFLSLLTNPSRPITYSCIDSSASYPHCSSRPVQALVTSGCCLPSTSSTFRDLFQNSFRSIYQHPQIFAFGPQLRWTSKVSILSVRRTTLSSVVVQGHVLVLYRLLLDGQPVMGVS